MKFAATQISSGTNMVRCRAGLRELADRGAELGDTSGLVGVTVV